MGPKQVDVRIAKLRAEIMQVGITPHFNVVPYLQWGMVMTAGDRKPSRRVLYVEHRRRQCDDALDCDGT